MTRSKTNSSTKAFAIDRRALMTGGLALGAAVLLPVAPAQAMTERDARRMVERLVDEVNGIIASGSGDSAKVRAFEKLFVKYADSSFMARYALGADGRGASASDLAAFTSAFEGYIARKYGSRFREFIGGRLEVTSAAKRKSVFEVKTTAFLRGSSPFEVTFQLSDRSGSDKFVNMFIEGVNLLLTERTEIGAMLDRRGGSIARVAQDLRAI